MRKEIPILYSTFMAQAKLLEEKDEAIRELVEGLKEAFEEGYDAAVHHEESGKAWKEFCKQKNILNK